MDIPVRMSRERHLHSLQTSSRRPGTGIAEGCAPGPGFSIRIVLRSLPLCLLLALASASTAQPTDPSSPNARRGLGLASPLLQEFDVGPGSALEGRLLLQNNTPEPQTVRLYQMDYVISSDSLGGAYVEVSNDIRPRSNLSWIQIPRSEVTIASGQTEVVPFQVSVPPDTTDSLSGTYWSVIFAEPLTGGQQTVETEDGTSFQITQRVRYGTHIATHVGSQETSQLSVVQTGLTDDEEDGYLFSVRFANSGLRSVLPRFWVELYDSEGGLVGRYDGRPPIVYPGLVQERTIAFGDLREGNYQGVLYIEEDAQITGYRLNLAL